MVYRIRMLQSEGQEGIVDQGGGRRCVHKDKNQWLQPTEGETRTL